MCFSLVQVGAAGPGQSDGDGVCGTERRPVQLLEPLRLGPQQVEPLVRHQGADRPQQTAAAQLKHGTGQGADRPQQTAAAQLKHGTGQGRTGLSRLLPHS